ncbi:MAG TPA: hypothetical protein VGJ94_01865 [Syntrophorhabdaceae bacterium]|jgi:hypothetical protein
MKKQIVCVMAAIPLMIFFAVGLTGSAVHARPAGHPIDLNDVSDEAAASGIVCAVSGLRPYMVSTFPPDALLLALFQNVSPTLKGYKLNVLGKTQNSATGVYTWYVYYLDSTNGFQYCSIDLTMIKNTNTKLPYYWLYLLRIPTGSTVTTCSGLLEQKYQ